MATKVFAQTNKEIDSYLYAYKNILSAVGFVNPNTGETIKLSAEQKIIWLHMSFWPELVFCKRFPDLYSVLVRLPEPCP